MVKVINNSTPIEDGFFMPAEYEPQDRIYMIWPERKDNWRKDALPAQEAYKEVAFAISEFTPVTMLANFKEYEHARKMLEPKVRVVEMPSNDAWCRDSGPTVLVNGSGQRRGCDWRFNAWGGLVDGLYNPWDEDDEIAKNICRLEDIEYYSLDNFVLEGGSIHVDGIGTVLTTEMCLLSAGRNPHLSKMEIEQILKDYLGATKVLWLKRGIDPMETNGHIDDVACFVRPGEVACIYTEDVNNPFYEVAMDNYRTLCNMTDCRGEQFTVHKICLPKNPVYLKGAETIEDVPGTIPRKDGDICIASYLNFLITNDGVIVPQYGDENDELALRQLEEIFPDKKIVGVFTKEIVYGGGNIHCITQQIPSPRYNSL
ncbi:MAG: agmatine deiminase [Pseudobutyrivibrio sp.]|nr:agmatine deiminase [Pseudobutyrivibrio sp.]